MKLKIIISLIIWASINLLANGKDFYFSAHGSDSNAGESPLAPFCTLEQVNRLDLKPGDRLLFKSGDRFTGMLRLDCQGESGKEIVISSYGDGPYPLLDGNGEESAIRLHNAAYVIIEKLKLTNWKGSFGIYLTAENAGEMNGLVFRDLDIHRVGKESREITEPSKSIGGLCGRIFKGKRPSWWNGLTISNLYIHDVGSCGITLGGNVNLYKTDRKDPYFKPHMNVVIEKCRIDSIVRDGIWIRQCENALIQHCEISRTGMNAVSNGCWFWDCIGSVMQYNEGWECGSPRGNDGAPFSIDNHCLDCIIQYNYSHDNEGPGYMIFGREGDGYRNIVRYNLSFNDNLTKTYKSGTACISIVSEVKEALVEGNIIVAGPESYNMLGHRNWEGFPHDVTYRNNLFVGNSKAGIPELEEVIRTGTFEGNLFINVPHLPEELQNQTNPEEYFMNIHNMKEIQSHAGIPD